MRPAPRRAPRSRPRRRRLLRPDRRCSRRRSRLRRLATLPRMRRSRSRRPRPSSPPPSTATSTSRPQRRAGGALAHTQKRCVLALRQAGAPAGEYDDSVSPARLGALSAPPVLARQLERFRVTAACEQAPHRHARLQPLLLRSASEAPHRGGGTPSDGVGRPRPQVMEVAVLAKGLTPERARIDIHPRHLHIALLSPEGEPEYSLDLELYGEVRARRSRDAPDSAPGPLLPWARGWRESCVARLALPAVLDVAQACAGCRGCPLMARLQLLQELECLQDTRPPGTRAAHSHHCSSLQREPNSVCPVEQHIWC
jgi:hypothetical protein